MNAFCLSAKNILITVGSKFHPRSNYYTSEWAIHYRKFSCIEALKRSEGCIWTVVPKNMHNHSAFHCDKILIVPITDRDKKVILEFEKNSIPSWLKCGISRLLYSCSRLFRGTTKKYAILLMIPVLFQSIFLMCGHSSEFKILRT